MSLYALRFCLRWLWVDIRRFVETFLPTWRRRWAISKKLAALRVERRK